MGAVRVNVTYTELENENGWPVNGVIVTCERCGHEVEVYGTSERSVTRGCATLREECPRGESNHYDEDAATDDGEEFRCGRWIEDEVLTPIMEETTFDWSEEG
jgi:hypothetical protein